MASDGKQSELGLCFGAFYAPKDAPEIALQQITSEHQALAVSMAASGSKLAYVAARIGVSEGYVSRMRLGKRPIPERLVLPLCAATGSNLLRQYIERTKEKTEVERIAGLLRAAG